jgi:hypothetical protein
MSKERITDLLTCSTDRTYLCHWKLENAKGLGG